ncbi:MAG: class I SAM-dependent methyltransferase [Desulfosalsimonadaceae bacterium]|nr:class I SAM-dependent methyltransferase [Desulfosalsimonadaceae bacterium]
MTAIGKCDLSALLVKNSDLRLVEPDIYSVFPDNEAANDYDTQFGNIYDRVACNPIYNRLMWGYSVAIFASMAREALMSSSQGNVLDVGCGSLAFTARTYIRYPDRPVVLVDQSLKMLKIAVSRLVKINGKVPDNMVFLHADALRLPFREKSFHTVISQNLLHCLSDTNILLKKLKNIVAENGKMYFTTLVKGNRFADRYLEALANGGKLVSRNMADHQAIFNQLEMPITYDINGNMASIYHNA